MAEQNLPRSWRNDEIVHYDVLYFWQKLFIFESKFSYKICLFKEGIKKKTTWKSASVQKAKHLVEGPKCSVTRSLFIYCFSVNLYITVDAFQEVSVTRTKYLFVRLGWCLCYSHHRCNTRLRIRAGSNFAFCLPWENRPQPHKPLSYL